MRRTEMSSLNLKQDVKAGKISPERALELLLENADNPDAARESRTGRWLRSPNAQKRFNDGKAKAGRKEA
jgi:hypothetical protein